MKPYKLDLSQFTEKQVERKKFRITNASDQRVQLKLVSSAPEFFDVELPKSIAAGEMLEGEVILTDKAMEESFAKSLTIETDDVNKTRFTLPVKRTLRKPATASTGNVKKVGH